MDINSENEIIKCQIKFRDDFGSDEGDLIIDIHEKVCVNDFPLTKSTVNGKYYCLFHIPHGDFSFKPTKFEEVFQDRLNSVKRKIEETQKLPEDQREKVKDNLEYDFRYVFFPPLKLSKYQFEVKVNFSGAFFTNKCQFSEAIFEKEADFSDTFFKEEANFDNTTFKEIANFENSTFNTIAKFENANFNSNANFRKVKFVYDAKLSANFDGEADFSRTIFHQDAKFFFQDDYDIKKKRAAKFNKYVNFGRAKFEQEANFSQVIFKESSNFSGAVFDHNADFSLAHFEKDVSFYETSFTNKYLRERKSDGKAIVNFIGIVLKGSLEFTGGERSDYSHLIDYSQFIDYSNFNNDDISGRSTKVFDGENVDLDLSLAQIEKPEKVVFQFVRLRPHWFVNVNAEKFVFTGCDWQFPTGERNAFSSAIYRFYKNFREVRYELKRLRVLDKNRANNLQKNKLLSKTCWQLADNYEANKHFEQASKFRKIAQESERMRSFWGLNIFSLHWWYWFSSSYGESWKKALIVLLGILLAFTFYYQSAFFKMCPKDSKDESGCVVRTMQIDEAIHQSVMTAALQNVDYRKTQSSGQDIVILLQKIFAPLQAALLALAIRRKFMR